MCIRDRLKTALMAAHVRCSSALTEPVPGTMLSVLDAAGAVPVPDTSADGSNPVSYTHLDVYKRQG